MWALLRSEVERNGWAWFRSWFKQSFPIVTAGVGGVVVRVGGVGEVWWGRWVWGLGALRQLWPVGEELSNRFNNAVSITTAYKIKQELILWDTILNWSLWLLKLRLGLINAALFANSGGYWMHGVTEACEPVACWLSCIWFAVQCHPKLSVPSRLFTCRLIYGPWHLNNHFLFCTRLEGYCCATTLSDSLRRALCQTLEPYVYLATSNGQRDLKNFKWKGGSDSFYTLLRPSTDPVDNCFHNTNTLTVYPIQCAYTPFRLAREMSVEPFRAWWRIYMSVGSGIILKIILKAKLLRFARPLLKPVFQRNGYQNVTR